MTGALSISVMEFSQFMWREGIIRFPHKPCPEDSLCMSASTISFSVGNTACHRAYFPLSIKPSAHVRVNRLKSITLNRHGGDLLPVIARLTGRRLNAFKPFSGAAHAR